jgi:hypothetical protein
MDAGEDKYLWAHDNMNTISMLTKRFFSFGITRFLNFIYHRQNTLEFILFSLFGVRLYSLSIIYIYIYICVIIK